MLVALSASPSGKLDNQTKPDNVDFQFAVNTYQSIIGFHITLAGIFMLPTVKPLLGIFIEWQALRLQLIILVMRTILCDQLIDNLLPLDFQFFRSFPVVPSAFQNRFRHHEKNTVNKTVTRTLALDQFAQNLLLNGTDNGDIGTSDKNGTLRTLAVGNRGLGIERRKPKLFFRTVIIAVEILEPSRQFVRPKAESSGILGMYQAQSFGSDI